MQDNVEKKKRRSRNYYTSYPKIAALSFLLIIAVGTVLLMLPVSVKQGSVGFCDALFTAASASCVTGLIQFDTFSKWTLFGQIVILCMIQIGGLGFITLVMLLTRFVKKRVSVKQKILLRESIGSIYTGDLRSLGRTVLFGTAFFELAGAALLSVRLIGQMGFKNGLYTAVFLSVSAFCNAGFDVMGRVEPGSSLITVNDDPLVLITLSLLIIIGGIGFVVWDDIKENRLRFSAYSFNSKLALSVSAALLLGGTVLYFAFEYNNTLSDMSLWQKILNSFFASVTARTAGFNSVPVGEMSGASKMLTYVLMFIGGSSGSTAGGIKTSTLAVLSSAAICVVKGEEYPECFGRQITGEYIKKAVSVVTLNISIVLAASFVISLLQGELDYFDILFECFSAMGTVGMTVGITTRLRTASKLIIAALMFIGRVSSLVFVLTFRLDFNKKSVQKPKGNLLIG